MSTGGGSGARPPPLAVVGDQASEEEEMFGAAFDGAVLRRFWGFLRPYRRNLLIALAGVVLFTLTQVMIPLLIRAAIDHGVAAGAQGMRLLQIVGIAFFAVVVVNYVANIFQEMLVGRIAGHLLFDLRRAMYLHLQRVSLTFMDKTQVGRLMSRLQGDVNALQEFLETSMFAFGDVVLLIGIASVLLWLDPRLGMMTLSVVPALLIVRLIWLPHAKKVFLRARETSSAVNGALAENVHGIRTIQEMGREQINFQLYSDMAGENLESHLRASRFANMLIPVVDLLTGLAMAIIVVVGGARARAAPRLRAAAPPRGAWPGARPPSRPARCAWGSGAAAHRATRRRAQPPRAWSCPRSRGRSGRRWWRRAGARASRRCAPPASVARAGGARRCSRAANLHNKSTNSQD